MHKLRTHELVLGFLMGRGLGFFNKKCMLKCMLLYVGLFLFVWRVVSTVCLVCGVRHIDT